jgi:hypothetical protein
MPTTLSNANFSLAVTSPLNPFYHAIIFTTGIQCSLRYAGPDAPFLFPLHLQCLLAIRTDLAYRRSHFAGNFLWSFLSSYATSFSNIRRRCHRAWCSAFESRYSILYRRIPAAFSDPPCILVQSHACSPTALSAFQFSFTCRHM